MTAALHIALTPRGPDIRPPTPMPVAALLLGKSAEEAAETLPRLFNLCRAAQGMGARHALGLPVRPEDAAALGREILREHLMRLMVLWPRRLGLPPAPLPTEDEVAEAVFGPSGHLPAPEAFETWLSAGMGVAPVIAAIAAAFTPGEAVANLPPPSPDTLGRAVAQENSIATRHPGDPLLAGLAARHGRGPLWRAVARLVDLNAALQGRLDLAPRDAGGLTVVPAARGAYALSAQVTGGRVTAFERHTPTDHLLAPGGALALSLASLPGAKAHLAPLVTDILDPCIPYEIAEAAHA